MERKTWVMPMTLVQKFEANETVAQCYYIGCDTGAANAWEERNHGWWEIKPNHQSDECGNKYQQIFKDTDGDGLPDKMFEERGSIWGTLEVTGVYSDENYSVIQDISKIQEGQRIYWITKAAYTYHHQGNAVAVDDGHPNRS